MTTIKAKETIYKGYRFRSRLEARWAVFFDAIGAPWEYEPEGFELSDGTCYLPDFYLPGVKGRGAENIYVEVKGVLSEKDLHKIKLFSEAKPIIIFGQIPEVEFTPIRTMREIVRTKGGGIKIIDVPIESSSRLNFDKDNNELFYSLEFSEGDYYRTQPWAAKGGGLVLDWPDDPYDFVDVDATFKAYAKARQARFEHGEHGGLTE